MKQIIQGYKNCNIDLAEVLELGVKAAEVLVRSVASPISPGTEKLMIEMG
jgi:23S rRNA-/tRNA-specific pseudouridylate synthase